LIIGRRDLKKRRFHMKHSKNLRARAGTICKLLSLLLVSAAPLAAQTAVRVAAFSSIELDGGGHVTLRHGLEQTVIFLKGNTDCAQATVGDGGKLIIKKNKGRCPKGYDLEIEIFTPRAAEISVSNGGTIQSRGVFPRQPDIKAVVRHGGTIDIRSITTDRVVASVEEGGGVFAAPAIALSASIVNGGHIRYWGDAKIVSSVRHGGAVIKGDANEVNKPLSELSPF
jgi:hypothetical protein